MSHALLVSLILSVLTLSNGNHYVKHCREAPEGCEERASNLATEFLRASEVFDMDPLLLVAIGFRETGLNPSAVGKRGERGVMQVLPSHLRDVNEEEDPMFILAATELLKGYTDWCGGSLNKGLGTYNAGTNLGVCPFNTVYARRVLRKKRHFAWLVRGQL